jgi:hypothetical protein
MNISRPITRDVARVKRFIVDDGHVKSKIFNAKKTNSIKFGKVKSADNVDTKSNIARRP